MHEHGLVVLSAILVTGMVCQWVAWRRRLPAILFLLICGILAGPILGWLHPDQLFGDLLFPFISLAVAVILFEVAGYPRHWKGCPQFDDIRRGYHLAHH
jgi:CPA1 family monovalent cation:H+ antiporter